jgi:ATP-dependent Clp protease ATP-binding subunit ClpB
MRMDKLTNSLQNALADAQSLALGKDHSQLEPVHVLQALLDQRGGATRPLLQRAGANLDTLQQALQRLLEAQAVVGNATGEVRVSPELSRVLNLADRRAQQSGDAYVSSETVLAALLEAGGDVAAALKASGVTAAALEQAIADVRGGEGVSSADAEETRQALEKYTIDLTERAATASSTRSSVATTRSVARSRCCSAVPRTTPYSSVSPVSARPPSSRASRSA